MIRARWLVSATLVLAATAIASCGGAPADTGPTEVSVHVENEFTYDPSEFSVKAGEQVTLSFENTGTVEHSFNILNSPGEDELEHALEEVEAGNHEHLDEELLVDMHAQPPGATETVTFTAPADPGDYVFFCSVPGHALAGAVGTMTVAP